MEVTVVATTEHTIVTKYVFVLLANAHTLGYEQGAGGTKTIIYMYIFLPGSSNDSILLLKRENTLINYNYVH